MIKGTRVEGTNSTAIGTGGTCPSLITVPGGKTFILTDIAMTPTYGLDDVAVVVAASAGLLSVYDFVLSGGTAASGNAAALLKIGWNMQHAVSGATAVALARRSAIYHFTNGPEFSNAFSLEVTDAGSGNIGTGCIWVGGILR
jgi:hypothetical protein